MSNLNDEVDAYIKSLENRTIAAKAVAQRRNRPQRLPPLASMEWSEDERTRLRTFFGQATRYRRQSLLARVLKLFRR